jgi:hypothetical protein
VIYKQQNTVSIISRIVVTTVAELATTFTLLHERLTAGTGKK